MRASVLKPRSKPTTERLKSRCNTRVSQQTRHPGDTKGCALQCEGPFPKLPDEQCNASSPFCYEQGSLNLILQQQQPALAAKGSKQQGSNKRVREHSPQNIPFRHTAANCSSNDSGASLHFYTWNILSWKGSTRIKKSSSLVNGPETDKTHNPDAISTMLWPTELCPDKGLCSTEQPRKSHFLKTIKKQHKLLQKLFLFYSCAIWLLIEYQEAICPGLSEHFSAPASSHGKAAAKLLPSTQAAAAAPEGCPATASSLPKGNLVSAAVQNAVPTLALHRAQSWLLQRPELQNIHIQPGTHLVSC